MNDRIVNILEQYDVTVLRTWKGRGAILCDTDKGLKIIREYTGPVEKLCMLEAIGKKLREAGFLSDCILRNKEGALYVRDRDQAIYIVKDHYDGRECAVSDTGDCVRAVRQLAQIQLHLRVPGESEVLPPVVVPPEAGPERDEAGENRGGAGAERNEAGEERGGAGAKRDEAGENRGGAGAERNEAGEERGGAGAERDEAGENRGGAGAERDKAGEERSGAGPERDEAGENRGGAGPERDEAGENRGGAGTGRYRAGAERDAAAADIRPQPYRFRMFCPVQEYERYNRELKRIQRYLRGKSAKTDFEVFLLHHYPFFMEQAAEALERIKESDAEELYRKEEERGVLCHGDFQYHNILFTEAGVFVMNYEKCIMDIQIRDFYLFFRKVLEKNNWNIRTGRQLLEAYDSVRPISDREKYQLYCKLCYPERFRKVVSYYHNSGKSWIPGKNREKIERLLEQETARRSFLKNLFEA